jgi:hypothetical protein
MVEVIMFSFNGTNGIEKDPDFNVFPLKPDESSCVSAKAFSYEYGLKEGHHLLLIEANGLITLKDKRK